MYTVPWQALGSLVPKKAIKKALGDLVTSFVINRFKLRKTKPQQITHPRKKPDTSEYTGDQQAYIAYMYKQWGSTQKEFTQFVNAMYGTDKSVSAMMRVVNQQR